MIITPKVSVIVPIYKAEKFLRKCVDSILTQTLQYIELILVDDGSPDNSGRIADQYAAEDQRVRVIHQSNSGPSVARNRGIKEARGDYIGFIDADDWIEPRMYEELYDAAESSNSQIAMCNYKEEDTVALSSNIITHPFKNNEVLNKERIYQEIIPTFAKDKVFGFYSMCNKIYNRNWLKDIDLKLDEARDHGEDWWFNIEAFTVVERIVFISESYYHYVHINSESLMAKYRPNQFEIVLAGRKLLMNKLSECGIDINDFKVELDNRFMQEVIGCIIRELSNKTSWIQQNKCIRHILSNEEVRRILRYFAGGRLQTKVLVLLMKYNMVNSLRCCNFVRKIIRN